MHLEQNRCQELITVDVLFDAGLLIASTSVVIATIAAAGCGQDLAWCLLTLALAPAATVIGFETLGYRRGSLASQ